MKKNSDLPFVLLASLALVWFSVAFGATNDLVPFKPAGEFPSTKQDFWKWGISCVTPVIVWLFGKIPKLPRPVLPILTPFVGVILGLILRWLAGLNLGWVDMAQAGMVAVFIRESINQLITKKILPLEDSKTDTKPVDGAIAVKGVATKLS
jgi:hypothetical protein